MEGQASALMHGEARSVAKVSRTTGNACPQGAMSNWGIKALSAFTLSNLIHAVKD